MAAFVVKAALRAEPAVIGNRNDPRATLIETAGLSSPEAGTNAAGAHIGTAVLIRLGQWPE